MGDRRFDADNDKGRPDLGTLRVRELVGPRQRLVPNRRSGRPGGLRGNTVNKHGGPPRSGRVRKYDLRGEGPLAVRPREVMHHD